MAIDVNNIGPRPELVRNAPSEQEKKKLREACENMEAEFLKILLKTMKETIPDSGLIEKSAGHDIVEDMRYERMAEDMAKKKSSGIADLMYKEFIKSYKGKQEA